MNNFSLISMTIYTKISPVSDQNIPLKPHLNTLNQWLLNIDKSDYNIAIFLDLRKAFDTVDHSLLILKLEYYGVLGTELRWFKSYLSGRQQYCSVNNKNSLLTIVRSGIPRDSKMWVLVQTTTFTTFVACQRNR